LRYSLIPAIPLSNPEDYAFIGLGANLTGHWGSPMETLVKAQEYLMDHGLSIESKSSFWSSSPVPKSDQPLYMNAVIALKTEIQPDSLLILLNDLEKKAGRVRGSKNEARCLDLDILAYKSLIINQNDLIIPHPRMSQRAFVLRPLQEIAPQWIHPILNKKIESLIEKLPIDQDIQKIIE
jgi:2-amino-4-hydroxy-6-hydroxymethyldihydropteridine diphosphokinase